MRDQAAGIETLGVVFGGSGNGEQIAANKVQRRPRRARVEHATRRARPRAQRRQRHLDRRPPAHLRGGHPVHRRASSPTPFSGEERHARRIAQLAAYETTGDIAGQGRRRSARRSGRRGVGRPRCPRDTPSTASPASSSATSSATSVHASSPQGRFAEGAAELDGRTDDRCPRRRQADVPRVRGRPVAARAPRHVRRVGLRRRHPDGRDDRVGERAHGADEPARHLPRRAEPRRGGVRPRRRELAHLDRRAAPHPRCACRSPRRRANGLDDVPARAGRPGAGAPAHRHDLRRPARSDRVRGARPRRRSRPSSRSSAPIRSSTTAPRPRSGSPRAVRRKATPIAPAAHGPAVVAGIGNVYRAELLFRARQNPHTPGQGRARGARAATSGATGRSCSRSASRPAR